MKYQELIILLPCHSLEDFPTHHEGDEAEGLLANWSALWHPALLASAQAIPQWRRVDDPPEEVQERLIVAPSVSREELPTGFSQRVKNDGGKLIRYKQDRQEIIDAALETLDGGAAGVSDDVAGDFLALGYCYLQIELLTRQMRYSSNLDETYFQDVAVAAAVAAVEGRLDEMREKLTSCFDVLSEERAHYYPVDAFILDITMLAPTTLGEPLRTELADPTPKNLLLSADLVEQMDPETRQAVQTAVSAGTAGLIGGEYFEGRQALWASESSLDNLLRGEAVYRQHLDAVPTIYGRKRFGLTPALPQILQQLGYQGALHATLEDGIFPEGSQAKVTWEGCDGTGVDALAKTPANASRPEIYLSYAVKMGETMDMDHVALIVLAHWPGQSSPWREDLQRIAKYGSALGKFVTTETFFQESETPVHQDRYDADQYRSPYLKQAVIRKHPDPISSSLRYWKRRGQIDAIDALETLGQLISGDAQENAAQELARQTQDVFEAVEAVEETSLDHALETRLQQAAEKLAALLPRDASQPPRPGCLTLNPHSYVRRMVWETDHLDAPPTAERPHYASHKDEKTQVVADVPSMGFVWSEAGKSRRSSKEPPLAEDNILRNEFMEALLDPTTGSLRSTYDYDSRNNRLSQQLALRIPDGREAKYSVMAADSMEVTQSSPLVGEITTAGRLLDLDGATLATFRQVYRLTRGSRVLEVDIELDPQTECRTDPWNSYYGIRFAWSNETAEVSRGVQQLRCSADAKRIESPQYLEIADGPKKTTILTGGLPYHRRFGMRMLDSLLVVRGETQRKFRIGIGVDLKAPQQEALNLLAPPMMLPQEASPPQAGVHSWLFHLDARNVLATHWSPICEEGKIVGVRARLLETANRNCRLRVQSFRPPSSARLVNFHGELVRECELEKQAAVVQLQACQWVQLELRW